MLTRMSPRHQINTMDKIGYGPGRHPWISSKTQGYRSMYGLLATIEGLEKYRACLEPLSFIWTRENVYVCMISRASMLFRIC